MAQERNFLNILRTLKKYDYDSKKEKERIERLFPSENDKNCYWVIVRSGGDILSSCQHLSDEEACLEAVKINGLIIQAIPEKYIDEKLCLEAVKNCEEALQFVPEKYKTEEICMAAFKPSKYNSLYYGFKFIPKKYLTKEMCLKALETDKDVFQFIPDEFKDQEMCDNSVLECPYNFKFVPKQFRNRPMCLAAVKHYAFLQYVPEELKDREICLEGVKGAHWQFQYVPQYLQVEIELLKNNKWKEPHKDLEEKRADFACCMCLVNKKCVVFTTCGHMTGCFSCSIKLNGKCPLCRVENQDTLVVYY